MAFIGGSRGQRKSRRAYVAFAVMHSAFAWAEPPPSGEPSLVSPPGALDATAAPSASPLPISPAAQPVEVTVRGASVATRMRQSSEAVKVVETERAKRASADLGEVLARTEGVSVRREAGLGSSMRFSMNGLTDDQIRFFLDGLPLEWSGFGYGIGNVPVNLLDRVEIYRGVVPVRFGADALGGAVNLVTRQDVQGTHVATSYEIGAYRTHRWTLGAQHLDVSTGLFARATSFVDYAKNDYPVDVEVADDLGHPSMARVRRFHDAYRAYGANAEVGFVKRPWADRLLLRAYATNYDKELQNNVVMTVPYGEPVYGETAYGATLRYEKSIASGLRLASIAGYGHRATDFVDVGTWVYDWNGRRLRIRPRPGEIDGSPTDQTVWQNAFFGRTHLAWSSEQQTFRLTVAPTYTMRSGEDRTTAASQQDPLKAERSMLGVVTGIEYKLDLFERALENVLFVKDYIYAARAEEYLPRNLSRRRDADRHRLGIGDGARLRLTRWLYAKASYEWATRLPRPDEVFGDGVRVVANLDLAPEGSHNTNLGFACELAGEAPGVMRIEVNGFDRRASDLIVLLGNGDFYIYQNVHAARSTGIEAAGSWESPGRLLALDGNVTWQSFRNVSSEGTFAEYDGGRIPNRPYFFANGSARFALHDISAREDELSVTWSTRYVHAFLRGWEQLGQPEYKRTIPSQLSHGVALTYLVRSNGLTVSSTLEMQNLSDEKIYDYFGVQRPGRSVYFKGTIEY